MKNKFYREIGRRQFLRDLAVLTLGGKIMFDGFKDYKKQKNEIAIYHHLPLHTHKIEVKTISENFVGETIEFPPTHGYGIVLNGKYITCAHILIPHINSGFGYMELEAKERDVFLYGKKLEELVVDKEDDVAILGIPSDLHLPDFPCEPRNPPFLGEEIYLIGNPHLSGPNIRKGRISDLDLAIGFERYTKNCFGIDIGVIPGDSGSPVVSKDMELLGICSTKFSELGYVKNIKQYLKNISKVRGKIKWQK